MTVCIHTHRRHHCEVWVEFFTFLLIWYQWPELLKMFLKLTEGSYCWFPWLVGSIFSLNVKGWETKPYCLALQWLLFQPLWCILFGERILEIISCYVYNLLSISGFCVFFFFLFNAALEYMPSLLIFLRQVQKPPSWWLDQFLLHAGNQPGVTFMITWQAFDQ